MNEVYVDPGAAGGGDGSILTPFNSWATAKPNLSAGAFVYLKGAGVIGEEVTFGVHDVTLSSYGAGLAEIVGGAGSDGVDSSGFRLHVDGVMVRNAAQCGVRLWASNSSVKNCVIHSCGQAGVKTPSAGSARSDIAITGNEIYSCAQSGVEISNSNAGVVYSNISILDNHVYSNGDQGILCQSSSTTSYFNVVTIARNVVHNNASVGIGVKQGTYSFPVYPTVFNKAVTIESNVSYSNGSAGIHIATAANGSSVTKNIVYENSANSTLGGIWTGSCSGLIVDMNHVYDNRTNGIDGMGIYDDQLNVDTVVTRNIVHGHVGFLGSTKYGIGSAGIASYRSVNSFISANICYGNITGYVHFGSELTFIENAKIYGNTCANNVRFGMSISGRMQTIRNNIAFGNDGWTDFSVSADSIYDEDYNCFVTSTFLDGGSRGSHSISGDPLFVDAANGDYRLRQTSPCLRRALFMETVSDFNGNPIYDMGALAFTGVEPYQFGGDAGVGGVVYVTTEGDTLDGICYQHYGTTDALIDVLDANPGLAQLWAALPVNVRIVLPKLELGKSAADVVRLWS